MARYTTCSIIIVITVIACSCRFAEARPRIPFTFYLHDNFIPGNETAVTVATAGGTNTSAFGAPMFGDIIVFNSPLRKTADKNSLLIGNSGGTIVALKEASNFQVQFTAVLNTTVYVGTVSAQGRATPLEPSWEVSIVGGTGDFRGARGHATVKTIPSVDPLHPIIQYTLNIYPDTSL